VLQKLVEERKLGYEIMHMLKKGQIEKVEKGAVRERVKFISEIFGLVA
jgi:hypothetical protein